MPPPNDPLTVLQTLQELESIKVKSNRIGTLMIAVEKAACDGIVDVINNYLDSTFANLDLPSVEAGSLESDVELNDINAAIARLKTGLPPVLA